MYKWFNSGKTGTQKLLLADRLWKTVGMNDFWLVIDVD